MEVVRESKTDLKLFSNPELGEIRTVEFDGEPWFVLRDICNVLEIKQTSDVAGRLDDDEVVKIHLPTNSGIQEAYVVNEAGIYNVILRSNMPQAKPFKRWVTHDILPAIRKTGSYSLPQLTQNEMILQLAQSNVELERRVAATEERNVMLEEKFDTAVKIFATSDRSWKENTEIVLDDLQKTSGLSMPRFKGKLYQELEATASVNLQSQLSRRQGRMKKNGATYRECQAVTKLDIISYDKKLRPIFEGIVRKHQAVDSTVEHDAQAL